MLMKDEIQARIKELEEGLMQQQQLVGQVNNNILMIHGAKEELTMQLRKIEEKEKLDQEKLEADKQAESVTLDDAS